MEHLSSAFFGLEAVIGALLGDTGEIRAVVTFVTRFLFPPLAFIIFLRCIWPLTSGGRAPKPWVYLALPNGGRLPVSHWENSVGRSKLCDLVLDLPNISRNHAVIVHKRDSWYISDLDSRGGVMVNGVPAEGLTPIKEGDLLTLAGVELTMIPAQCEREEESGFAARLNQVAARVKPGLTLVAILLFQILGVIEFCFARGENFSIIVPGAYIVYMLLEVLYFVFTRGQGRKHIEPELLAFFLSGMGLFVAATTDPMSMFKQFGAIILGVVLFLILSLFLNNPDRARTARYVFAIGAIVLLGINLLIAPTRFGARNWIEIGPVSFQPSEFVKVAFVFAGASTLDKLLTRRNLALFLGFSAVCMGALVLMRDFGAAAIFFIGFLIMAFMRSGDIRTLGVVSAVTAAGAGAAFFFMPYIMQRFSAWRHVWEYPATTGYQQTRTMIYTASGGLLGVGSGRGYLKYVAAADTDLVFGLVAEEWGLIVAFVCALAPLSLAVFSAMAARASKSAFYAIAACGAAAILLAQAALNVFGSLDILPLTGVTLPFVSNGGSSMVSCWGLLACIKSADERHRI